MEKPLAIIGLDPGTTSAFVALDLQGQIIKIFSGKELTLSEIISSVFEIGHPLLVSTDKKKAPSFIEEFSRKTGAKLIVPKEDLLKEEKRELLREHFPEKEHQDQHQFDSLAAAVYALKKIRPTLIKINNFLKEQGLEHLREEFTQIALKEDLHFQLIKSLLTAPAEKNKIICEIVNDEKREKITKKDFLKLYCQLSNEEKEKEYLQQQLQKLKKEISLLKKTNLLLDKKSSDFQGRLDRIFKFKEERLQFQSQEMKKQKELLLQLNQRITDLFSFISQVPKFQLVKKLSTLSQKEFTEKNKILNFRENDFVFVANPQIYSEHVLRELSGKNIVILSPQKVGKDLRQYFSTLIAVENLFFLENDSFALLDKTWIEEKTKEKAFIEGIISDYTEKRRGERDAHR